MPVPKRVDLTPSHVLVEWSDGHKGVHPNKALREECPCALCQGEPPAIGVSRVIRLLPAAPEGVQAVRFSMVGRYAIAFAWSDGHSTGIYPYDYLLSVCECEACIGDGSASRVR